VKDEREADKIAEPTSMFVYQQPNAPTARLDTGGLILVLASPERQVQAKALLNLVILPVSVRAPAAAGITEKENRIDALAVPVVWLL
jgi:hypothetical protein